MQESSEKQVLNKYVICLQITCHNLKIPKSRGIFSHLCPQAQLFQKKIKGWKEIGSTERVKKIKNPFFFKRIYICENFKKLKKSINPNDENPILKLVLFDVHKKKIPIIIGQTGIYFDKLEERRQRRYRYELKNLKGEVRGIASINAELILIDSPNQKKLRFGLFAENVKNIEFLSLTDPFLVFYRPDDLLIGSKSHEVVPEFNWTMLHKTDHVMDELNPVFQDWVDYAENIYKEILTCWIKVEIWDYSSKNRHTVISTGYFRWEEIYKNKILKVETVDTKGKFCGNVGIKRAKLKKVKKLSSYDNVKLAILVKEKISLGVTIAIDFSEENSVYHSQKRSSLNRCLSTIQTVFWALKPYLRKKAVKIFGCSAEPKFEEENEELKEVINEFNPEIFKLGFKYDKGSYEKYDSANKHYFACYEHVKGKNGFKVDPIFEKIQEISKNNRQEYEWNETQELPYEILIVISNGNSLEEKPEEIVKKLGYMKELPISVIWVCLGEDYNDSFLEWRKRDKNMNFRVFVHDGSVGVTKDHGEFSAELFQDLVSQIEGFLQMKEFGE